MKRRALLIATAVLALAGLYATPYVTLHQMRKAAAADDAPALAARVDFPALRENLKADMQQRMLDRDRNERGEPSPASTFGAALAGALLGPMVDALITPEALARILEGQRPVKAAIGFAKPRPEPGSADRARARLETAMGYESLNRFVFRVRHPGDDEDPIELVLHRDGLIGWKLAELRLP